MLALVRSPSVWIPLTAGLAIFAALAGFTIASSIGRALFVHDVVSLTGLNVAADSIVRDGDAYDVRGLRATTPDGGARVTAPRARIRLDGTQVLVALERPAFDVAADRWKDVREQLAPGAELAVHVDGGTLSVRTGDAAGSVVSCDAIAGTLDAANARVRYDLSLALADGVARYPISARSVQHDDGTQSEIWSAPLVPLEPFVPLVANGDAFARGGSLRDVVVDDGPPLHASARLDGVAFALGTHELTGVHGELTVIGNGLGSPKLAGELDGIPVDGAGEVHDLHGRYAWLRDGSNDLRRVARLLEAIAGETNLRSAHVETTAPGLAFGQYAIGTDHGPLAVSLLSIDPSEPTLHFDTAIAEDHIISGGERTSAMGVRTHAVAGVNGDYFDIGRTYQPQGLLIRGGTLLRGPVDRAALAIDKDKHVTFSEFHFSGIARVAGRSFPVTQFNNWPAGDVTVITPAFGKMLPAEPGAKFAALAPLGDGRHYRVSDVVALGSAIPISFGLAFGPKTAATLHPGEIVDLEYGFDPPIGDAVVAIGGGPILVKDGAWYEDPHAPAPDERNYRWPVVALARLGNGDLLFAAVDGRHPERSVGMTRPEFGDLLLRMGAVDAMALDSGGSVTLVSRVPGYSTVTVRNVPSDGSAERWVSDALFLYSSAPPPTIVTPAVAATPVPEARPAP